MNYDTMIPRTLSYPPADRELYRQGVLYGRWKKKYGQTTIFSEMLELEATTKQFPVNNPPLKSQTYGFGELFAGIHYLNLGFKGVSRHYYYCVPGYDSYEKAVQVLGQDASKFICQLHPQPPDLLVFDKKGRFFLVEAKLPPDKLNPSQRVFFPRIERYLNKNMPESRRAPHMPKGHWIEVLSLTPETDKSKQVVLT